MLDGVGRGRHSRKSLHQDTGDGDVVIRTKKSDPERRLKRWSLLSWFKVDPAAASSTKFPASAVFFSVLLALPLLVAALYISAVARSVSGAPPAGLLSVAQRCLGSLRAAASLGDLHSSHFPQSFVFGTATAAFQIEGGVDEGGRGPSIWDVFSHTPGKIKDGSNADIASDSYHKALEDVAIINEVGFQAYRFSISWSRIIPDGSGEPNEEGIAYYNRLIDALLAEGIAPTVTLYHWDLPQGLQAAYFGWLNRQVARDFVAYAELCFQRFGDRVKTWITINEPQHVAVQGHGNGAMAPGRCSNRTVCEAGDSATEPYRVAHHLLLAHAAAVKVYREKYQKEQGGRIGIVLDSNFFYPMDGKNATNLAAAQRGMEFQLPWFADPLLNGTYPRVMVEAVGPRLPAFTEEESELVKGSLDFLGLNFYTSAYARADLMSPAKPGQEEPWRDRAVRISYTNKNGVKIGEDSGSSWLKVVPQGIYSMLVWVHLRYPAWPIIVTENGCSQDGGIPPEEAVCDTQRIGFFRDYLLYVNKAIQDGVPVLGYYAWSIVDNFEWAAGFTQRFGLFHLDVNDPTRQRIPKASAVWWKNFLTPRIKAE